MKISPIQRTIIEAAIYLTSAAVLWRGRNIALKDPLTRGYAAIASSHIAMSAMIRFASRVPEKSTTDRMCQNILGIGFALFGAVGLKSLLAEKSWIKLDGRAILGTAVGSATLGTVFDYATRESRDELPPTRVTIAGYLENIVKIQSFYRGHLVRKQRIEPQSPPVREVGNLDMISSIEDFRASELEEKEYQDTYEKSYYQEVERPVPSAIDFNPQALMIQRAYRKNAANKIPLPENGIASEIIRSLEEIRDNEVQSQTYQEAYVQHDSKEPPERPDTPALGYLNSSMTSSIALMSCRLKK